MEILGRHYACGKVWSARAVEEEINYIEDLGHVNERVAQNELKFQRRSRHKSIPGKHVVENVSLLEALDLSQRTCSFNQRFSKLGLVNTRC